MKKLESLTSNIELYEKQMNINLVDIHSISRLSSWTQPELRNASGALMNTT